MSLVLTEEQQMLKGSIKELLKEYGGVAQLRALRDSRDATGYHTTLWQQMVEMGLPGLIVPEQYGGLDFGYTGLGQVLEEMGRTLTASPLIASVLLCGTALRYGGTESQQSSLFPSLMDGSLTMAFASDEGKRHRPFHIETTATPTGDGYVINGTKTMVLDGHVANKWLVSARTPEGACLLILVDATADGATVKRDIMMDSRNSASIHFEQVKVDESAVLNGGASGEVTLQKVLDIGCIGIAAEMLGSMLEAFERTVNYLKEREQFGVKIGTFQALQHRAANMFCEIELCKSIVIKALKAIDEESKDVSKLASLAKAKCGLTYKLVSNEGVQMYGGIGMTDDEEIGFFLKRARVAQQTLGDANFHLDRIAKMKGY